MIPINDDKAMPKVIENITLFAKWQINKYSVTFNSQGGSSVNKQKVEYNKLIQEPNQPIRTGFSFQGWFKEDAGINRWDFSKDKVIEDITIFAKWEIISYTIQFNSQGGSSVAEEKVEYNKLIPEPNPPIQTSYVFQGWFKEMECINMWDFSKNKVTEDITLFAKWVFAGKIVIQPNPEESQECYMTHTLENGTGGRWQNSNFGYFNDFHCGSFDVSSISRALIRFELPQILNSKKILSAKLFLSVRYWYKRDNTNQFTINIYQMLRSWKEGHNQTIINNPVTNSAFYDGATALERFWGDQDGSEDWNKPHVGMDDVDAKAEPITQVTRPNNDFSGWEFDVTELIQFWIDNPSNNFGIMLRCPHDQIISGKANSYPVFFTGEEASQIDKRPKLEIHYEEGD